MGSSKVIESVSQTSAIKIDFLKQKIKDLEFELIEKNQEIIALKFKLKNVDKKKK